MLQIFAVDWYIYKNLFLIIRFKSFVVKINFIPLAMQENISKKIFDLEDLNGPCVKLRSINGQ